VVDHRREVLRRSKHRLAEITHRLEMLGGSVAYPNLDKVIKIIRSEDDPSPSL
jgi:topoisomerase-4 subunit A